MLIYTNIQHNFRKKHNLTCNEYVFCDMVYFLSNNEKSKHRGWCYAKKESLAEDIGISKQSIFNIMNKMIEHGFIVKDDISKFIKTTEKWQDVYFTQSKETLPESNNLDESSKETLPEHSKETLPEHSKETLPNNNSIYNNNLDNKDHNIVLDQKKSFKKWDLKDFENSIKEALIEFEMPKSEVLSFYEYWKEKTPDCKFRFQLQKTWHTDLRLKTWVRNENKWNPQKGKDQNKDQMKDAFMGYMEGVMSGKY